MYCAWGIASKSILRNNFKNYSRGFGQVLSSIWWGFTFASKEMGPGIRLSHCDLKPTLKIVPMVSLKRLNTRLNAQKCEITIY